MKRETSCAPSKFGYLGVQIYLTLPRTPPQNIASNRRLEEGDPILARMDTYTGRICVEAVARATQGAGEEKFWDLGEKKEVQIADFAPPQNMFQRWPDPKNTTGYTTKTA